MIRGGVVLLNVSDVARAVRFYIETLGMKLVRDDGAIIIDAGEGFHLGLRKGPIASGANDQPGVIFYPKVPIDEAIAIYENRGVVFVKIDRDEPTKTLAYFKDDDGNLLALSSAG
jgi:catechol 2,3-dioxygenase-like lactoylglutathione lyase family enzyme